MIGNTPLVELDFGTPARVYAKLEYCNPSGSIKDRSAQYMISVAEQRGDIHPGGTIIEASSGNQGIATAMIARIKGYNTLITVTDKVSQEKQKTLAAYGSKIISYPDTQSLHDPRSYHRKAQELAQSMPNSYMLNQYYNPDNVAAHYYGIGPEIWQQTQGRITHLCAGAGSGGTISGAGRYLKENNSNITILGVDSPYSYRSTGGNPQPYILEGASVEYESPLIDYDVIDTFLLAYDTETISMLHWLPRHHGIFVGPAGAAVASQAYAYARHLTSDDTLVMIFGDSGRAYVSKSYMQEQKTHHTPYVDHHSHAEETRS